MKEKAWAIMEEKDAQLRAARVSTLQYILSCQPCRGCHCTTACKKSTKGTSGIHVGQRRDVLALQAEMNHTAPDNGGMESPLPLSQSASLSMSQPASGTAALAGSSGPEQQALAQQALSSSSEQVQPVRDPVCIALASDETGVFQCWHNGDLHILASSDR